MVVGQSRVEAGHGAVRPRICTAGVPAVEMACRLDQGTSVLEGSNVQKNWATNFGGVVGEGGGNKDGEAVDVLGTIAGSGGSSGSIATAQGKRQWKLPEHKPPPLPALRASLARKGMVRMSLSSSPSLVGVSTQLIIILNFLALVLP
jgi:hypothetical protein